MSVEREQTGKAWREGAERRKSKVFLTEGGGGGGGGVYHADRGVNYRRHMRKYVSVYSIIRSVCYCHPDTLRMRVSRRFFIYLFGISVKAYKMDVFTFPP